MKGFPDSSTKNSNMTGHGMQTSSIGSRPLCSSLVPHLLTPPSRELEKLQLLVGLVAFSSDPLRIYFDAENNVGKYLLISIENCEMCGIQLHPPTLDIYPFTVSERLHDGR